MSKYLELFKGEVGDLTEKTKLENKPYVAYSTKEGKVVYTVVPEEPTSTYQMVDLGLPSGLKWATCNVGATTSEEYGDYYAWGETTTKTEYTGENYTLYEQELGDISGNPTYDVARANWGSTWRMPTKEEMEELANNCTWTWTTQNGVNGYTVTGSNGSSIFLPAAGSYYISVDFAGWNGYYWSSTPYETTYDDAFAYRIFFGLDSHDVNGISRSHGNTVRPVSD